LIDGEALSKFHILPFKKRFEMEHAINRDDLNSKREVDLFCNKLFENKNFLDVYDE
jgi:hypothetical protein